MASYDEDAVPADLQEKAKKVTFKFCRECSNMLYPQEDNTNSRLMFTCRNCTYSEAADSACVYRNALKEEVAETAGNVDDVAEDPTVGDGDMDDTSGDDPLMDVEVAGEDVIPELCTLCGNEIVCPQCDQPTDHFMALQADDPAAALHDPQKEEEQVEAERRERALSGALPHTDAEHCAKCGYNDAVFFQSQQRTNETGMALFFVCVNCKHVWSTNDRKKK